MERDYYSLLGVSRFASQNTLRRAFRSCILQIHPDRNPTDIDAADRARRVIEAYKVLCDPKSRRRYDNTLAMPAYVMTPRYRYEAACPLWLTRCFVLMLFFAMSAGLFCIVAQSFADSTTVFRPMLGATDFREVAPSAASNANATLGDKSIGWRLNCVEEIQSPDPLKLH